MGRSAGTSLKEANPALIMVRISAYGQTGPYRDRPGFGRIANAFGGISYLAGYPDRAAGDARQRDAARLHVRPLRRPWRAARTPRGRGTGFGQVVDIGLYESIFRILDELIPAYAYRGYVRERMGPGTVNVVPHSHYPTADGKWIAIACTNDKIFQRLAEHVGSPNSAVTGRWGTIAQARGRAPASRRLSSPHGRSSFPLPIFSTSAPRVRCRADR